MEHGQQISLEELATQCRANQAAIEYLLARQTADDRLLTAEEAAQMYSIAPKTLIRFSEEGKAPRPVRWLGDNGETVGTRKFGRKYRWRKSDIVAHIRGMEQA